MGKLLPVILALIGLGAGVGAGLALRPADIPVAEAAAVTTDAHGETAAAPEATPAETGHGEATTSDFVKLNNQFIVPVVKDGDVRALVVLSLSLEVGPGETEAVYQLEPKLRDVFLQVMFDHANAGGFDGTFTTGPRMSALRQSLFEAARGVLGDMVSDVLITDMARQDM